MVFSLWCGLVAGMALASQTVLDINRMQDWKLEISTEWDVLGPFPINAREQHFISPSFPLDLSFPYQHEPNRTWPSSQADGGQVGWQKFNLTENGRLLVSFPHIRWSTLRSTEGWAALQHHNVLHTTLKLTPPAGHGTVQIPWLAFSFQSVSFFALAPAQPNSTDTPFAPEWNPGNIYALPWAPKQLVEPPALSLTEPTIYHLFGSGDYEIRLFGDPKAAGHEEPVLDVSIGITLESRQKAVLLDPGLHVACDFVQGWAFGRALGIGLHATDGRWEVLNIEPALDSMSPLSFSLLYKQRLTSSQTRVVPIMIEQHEPFLGDTLQFNIVLFDLENSKKLILTPTLDIRQLSRLDVDESTVVKATYFLAGTPTPFLAIPPSQPNRAFRRPPVIALHGAGVDVLDLFWPASLPRQPHSWLICPTGRTSWGFDWHGPSAEDAWGSLAALTDLLSSNTQWAAWEIHDGTRVVVIGHSNGGQGAWYLAARYPDRIFAAVPAAAYIKSQQYIPLSLSRGFHFIDPACGAILAASLTPDDNDLFLTNVVDTDILAIHGGDDENVPTWHSRELVGLVKSSKGDANISFFEDTGRPHWYSEVLTSSRVRNFLSYVLRRNDTFPSTSPRSFTLTVAIPEESGSFHGFSIRELVVPGRLAKLRVSEVGELVTVKTKNVHTFSIDSARSLDLLIDEACVRLPRSFGSITWLQRAGDSWTILPHAPEIRPMGPISQILRSPSPLLVIIPCDDRHAHSIAKRLAYAMLLYFRLDTEIITDVEALGKPGVGSRTNNVVVIGSNNRFGHMVLQSGPGIVKVSLAEFSVRGERFIGPSLGLVFLHPHPSASSRVVLFICGTDNSGLERAARLFLPIRTGVPLPEFMIIGSEADSFGAGGLRGAGFWDRTWAWNEAMAWLD